MMPPAASELPLTIKITGDGMCLFRFVAYGACLRSEKPCPSESLQELADDLQLKVVQEFVKWRADTEWMPITVYMYTNGSNIPKVIAEYGQEYGKDNPIRVLYDGYGHYDALQSPTSGTQLKSYTSARSAAVV